MEGLKAALVRGRKGGRRRKLSDEGLAMAKAMLKGTAGCISSLLLKREMEGLVMARLRHLRTRIQ
jgi:hypothetical protein